MRGFAYRPDKKTGETSGIILLKVGKDLYKAMKYPVYYTEAAISSALASGFWTEVEVKFTS